MSLVCTLGSPYLLQLLVMIHLSKHVGFSDRTWIIIYRFFQIFLSSIQLIELFGKLLAAFIFIWFNVLQLCIKIGLCFNFLLLSKLSQFFGIFIIFPHLLLFFIVFENNFVHGVKLWLFQLLGFVSKGLLKFSLILVLLMKIILKLIKSSFFSKGHFPFVFHL